MTQVVAEEKKVRRELFEKKMQEDQKLVRGKFQCLEVPNGCVKFSFRKWPCEQIQTYEMQDGHEYTIPLGLARHLANNCWYPIHEYAVDKSGKRLPIIGTKVKRVNFIPMDFMENVI